jgi:hypothetical protein
MPWLIREDVARAVSLNRWLDVLWTTPVGRATFPPSQFVALPVILPRWETFAP